MEPNGESFVSDRAQEFLLVFILCLSANQLVGAAGPAGVDSHTCEGTSPTRHLKNLNITVSHKTMHVPLHRHRYGINPDDVYGDVYFPNQPIRECSSCPWTIRIHTDSSRIPHTISYVQCKYKNCKHQSEHGGLCKETMREFSVLKRECTPDGKFSLQRVFQRFPVACVCVPRLPAHLGN